MHVPCLRDASPHPQKEVPSHRPVSCSEWLFVQRHNDFFSSLFLAPPSKLRNQAQSERYGYKEVKKSSFCPETSPRSTTTSPDRDGLGRWREQGGGKMKLACSPLVPRESEGLPRRSWGLPSSADATWPHVWFLLTPGLPSFFPGGA